MLSDWTGLEFCRLVNSQENPMESSGFALNSHQCTVK